MTARRKTPSLDDAGFMVYQLSMPTPPSRTSYDVLQKEIKRHYVKLALEVWREVEKCI